MDYKKIVDKELKKIKILLNNVDDFLLIFCVVDSNNLIGYIKENIQKNYKDIVLFDFYKERKDGCIEQEKYKSLINEGHLVLMSGFLEYSKFLKEIGVIKEEGNFYFYTFNLPRDNFYLRNNAKMILLTNEEEFKMFLSEKADDFTSYRRYVSDINSLIREENKDIKKLRFENK